MNNVLERTAAATGVNRNTVSKTHTIRDVSNWKNKPGVPNATRIELVIPKKFSIVVRQEVCEIHLGGKQLSILDLILEILKQKKVSEFDKLNLFYRDEIPEQDSKIWISGCTSSHWFMKSIVYVYADKISH